MQRRAAKSFVDGFRAAARRQRALLEAEGPDVARAIDLAVSMIEAAGAPSESDPVREAGVREVRRTWQRLHAKLGA